MQTLKYLFSLIDAGSIQLLSISIVLLGIALLPILISYRLIIAGLFILAITLFLHIER